MKRQTTHSSDLICSQCGAIFTIPRLNVAKREKYHIKDIECYKCRKITKFIELGDASVVKKELEFAPYLTNFEKNIYDLLTIEEKKNVR